MQLAQRVWALVVLGAGVAPWNPVRRRVDVARRRAVAKSSRSSRAEGESEGEGAQPSPPHAQFQFVRGVEERVTPTVSVTRSANSLTNAQQEYFTGTATFWFSKASALTEELTPDRLIQGMFLVDEEGLMVTTDVHAHFERGRPVGISSVLVLSNPIEWHRFMRFMKRYSQQHGLSFTSADGMAKYKAG